MVNAIQSTQPPSLWFDHHLGLYGKERQCFRSERHCFKKNESLGFPLWPDHPVARRYEPIGGTAFELTGSGLANPIAQILSGALMLRCAPPASH